MPIEVHVLMCNQIIKLNFFFQTEDIGIHVIYKTSINFQCRFLKKIYDERYEKYLITTCLHNLFYFMFYNI